MLKLEKHDRTFLGMTVVCTRFLNRPTDGSISSGLITSSSSLKRTCEAFRFRLRGFAGTSGMSPITAIRRLCAVLNSVRF